MMAPTLCHGCGEPINRPADASEWRDVTLAEHHAGCRPGAGRIAYQAPRTPPGADPFGTDDEHRTEDRVQRCAAGHRQEPHVCRDVLVCRHGEQVRGRGTPAWACVDHAGLCHGCWRGRRAGVPGGAR